MSKDSGIEWTEHTYNPWWGCTKVSEGCANCYAETYSTFRGYPVWGEGAERRTFGDTHWAEPLKWNAAAEAAGVVADVFCGSMCDVMEERIDLNDHRHRLWPLIERTPWLRWLLLTKRPENYARYLPAPWLDAPPANVMLGATAENQRNFDRRNWHLRWVRAFGFKTFWSMEPLLGPIDVTAEWRRHGANVDWVIVGGESGRGARPMHPAWVAAIRDACQDWADVPFFFKQWGEFRTPDEGTPPTHFLCACGHWEQLHQRREKHVPSAICSADTVGLVRLGKKAAGRVLDGQEWNQKPAPVVPAREAR